MPAMLLTALARFAAATVVLGAVALIWGDALAQAWLPLCRAEIEAFDDIYGIDQLALSQQGADRVIRMDVHQARYFVLGGRTVVPHPLGRASSTTLVANLLLPATLLIASGLTWPARRAWGYLTRLPLLAAATLLLAALDVPLVLWAGIWGLHVEAFTPGSTSPVLVWVDMLQSGARIALPLVVGVLLGWACERCWPAPRLRRP
ncbi:hypothetical protein [Aquabacterium sp.]|uniref:hypothetical protein n=1 Tax=Aquabacterium sp. TaxID=1872578 RepID=UPI0035B0A076